MLKNFLKRFEKLEHAPADGSVKGDLRVSKRFERLEIGDKKIEISIEDKITPQEKAPPEIRYFIFCPYCGIENTPDSEICTSCQHSLRTLIARQYQKQLLKRCVCRAVNQQERKNCWACGRDFSLWGDKDAQADSDNVIVLNIDGTVYRSTDRDLPPGIVILMEKIRREGYKKEIIDEWIQERNLQVEKKQQETQQRLTQIQYGLFWRTVGLILVLIFVIFQLRVCFRF